MLRCTFERDVPCLRCEEWIGGGKEGIRRTCQESIAFVQDKGSGDLLRFFFFFLNLNQAHPAEELSSEYQDSTQSISEKREIQQSKDSQKTDSSQEKEPSPECSIFSPALGFTKPRTVLSSSVGHRCKCHLTACSEVSQQALVRGLFSRVLTWNWYQELWSL